MQDNNNSGMTRRSRQCSVTKPIPYTTVRSDFAELELQLSRTRTTRDIRGIDNARTRAQTVVIPVGDAL